MIHRTYKVFEIQTEGAPYHRATLVDLNAINGMPPFGDLGEAEQWLKANGGQGVGPKHTIIEMIHWDYER